MDVTAAGLIEIWEIARPSDCVKQNHATVALTVSQPILGLMLSYLIWITRRLDKEVLDGRE